MQNDRTYLRFRNSMGPADRGHSWRAAVTWSWIGDEVEALDYGRLAVFHPQLIFLSTAFSSRIDSVSLELRIVSCTPGTPEVCPPPGVSCLPAVGIMCWPPGSP